MKKLTSLFLSLILVLPMSIPAFAAFPDERIQPCNGPYPSEFVVTTNEAAMPLLSEAASRRAALPSHDTLSVPARALWASETSEVLERAYEQKVTGVSEDTNYIIFEYECDDSKLEEGQLLLTKYLKPESNLAATTSASTKLNYAWGWSSGYSYKNDSKSALANSSGNIFLSVFSDTVTGLPVGTVISAALSLMEASADYSRPISVTDWVKFYYCNKIGYVKDTNFGYWLPYAQVGERRGFNKIESIVYDTYGQPHTIGYMEETGIPSENPRNSAKVEKKSHYDDDAWIISKALSQYQNDAGTYSQIYAVVGHFTETMP